MDVLKLFGGGVFRSFALGGLVAGALLAAACKQETAAETPYTEVTVLESGAIVHATMYSGPPTQTDRGHITIINGKITIYSNDLVVIVDSGGIKHAAPLEWCSEIVYK